MIGIWGDYSAAFLRVLAAGVLLFFGLPMLIHPLGWAKALRWKLPEHTHLAIYFGRCLAGLICVMALFALRAAADPSVRLFYFDFIMSCFVAMTAVHIYGAIRKIQPTSETLEIGFWALLLALAFCFYPVNLIR